jgi:hypothetical protein
MPQGPQSMNDGGVGLLRAANMVRAASHFLPAANLVFNMLFGEYPSIVISMHDLATNIASPQDRRRCPV